MPVSYGIVIPLIKFAYATLPPPTSVSSWYHTSVGGNCVSRQSTNMYKRTYLKSPYLYINLFQIRHGKYLHKQALSIAQQY